MRYPGFLKTFGSRLGAGLADELLDRIFPRPPTFLECLREVCIEAVPAALQILAKMDYGKPPTPADVARAVAPEAGIHMPKPKALGEFTCPKCGGHTWSTMGFDENGTYLRYCANGLETAYPELNPNTVSTPCQFQWKATEDHLYFTKPSADEARRAVETVVCAMPPDRVEAIADSILNRDWPTLEAAVGSRKLSDEHLMGAAARLLTEADAFIAKQSKQIEDLILDNVFPDGKGEIGLMLSAEMAKKIGLRYAENAPPIRVALVLDGWQWAVRLGLGRVGGELLKIDWAKADELLRDAKTAWMSGEQTEMAQNAAGGVA